MALTKVMANEGGEHNILVNALLIGLIMSDQRVKRHAAQAPNMDFDEFAKGIPKGTPLGRIGTAEEFANLACFLARLRAGFLHHRHSHQCPWRPIALGLASSSDYIKTSGGARLNAPEEARPSIYWRTT
jgi:hypothetical protein